MSDSNLTLTGPEDRIPQLEAPTPQGTHPQMMPTQMGNRTGSVEVTTHFRTRTSSDTHSNALDRPSTRDIRPEMVVATVSSPKEAPPPSVREVILVGGRAWYGDFAPTLVRQWIIDSDFDARSDTTIELSDDEKFNGTIYLDSSIELGEGAGGVSHFFVTDQNEKSNRKNSAVENYEENGNRNNADGPSDEGNNNGAVEESANGGNPVADRRWEQADGNNNANFDDDLDSSNTSWPTHYDVRSIKSHNSRYPVDEDNESVRTSNTPWPLEEGGAAIGNNRPIEEDARSNSTWSAEIRSSNSPWPIREDARSNVNLSDVRNGNSPVMSAEEEGSDSVPDPSTSFLALREAMWRKIQTAMQHDSTLVGFYNEQFLARQREDPNLTYDQWLDIKVREEIETKKFEEAGGAYGLDVAAPFQIRVEGFPDTSATRDSGSDTSTLPSVYGHLLDKH